MICLLPLFHVLTSCILCADEELMKPKIIISKYALKYIISFTKMIVLFMYNAEFSCMQFDWTP